jgi:hydroxymethylglutaryl-CoA lyase
MQRLYIQEVVTRDGFQAESSFIPSADKIALINRLSQAGYAKIEVTSFTSPKAIPMLADAEEVMSMTRADSAKALGDVIRLAHDAKVAVNVSLSTSFGCPMSGMTPLSELMHWIDHFANEGVRGISICDTTGMANPQHVKEVCEQAQSKYPAMEWTLHFHNTRGMGLANALAAVEAGINRFDSSLGGLGGCPYAPGATGNVCTEELVHMFDLMGYNTNINLDLLLECSAQLRDLVGRALPSQLLLAGKVDRIYETVCQS